MQKQETIWQSRSNFLGLSSTGLYNILVIETTIKMSMGPVAMLRVFLWFANEGVALALVFRATRWLMSRCSVN